MLWINDCRPSCRSRQNQRRVSRRQFLSASSKSVALAALANALPQGWVVGVYASDAPETVEMKFGMIALTDCSPIVIAHEKGFFKSTGSLRRWRKAELGGHPRFLSNGTSGDPHAPRMPIASTMGLAGAPKKPMVIPWLLNRNGHRSP